MTRSALARFLFAGCALALAATAGMAAQGAPKQQRPSALNTMGSNREPIKIDSDKLSVFDKESRAVFSGNVIAVQGDSTMKCSELVVSYEQQKNSTGPKPKTATPGTDQSQIKKIECEGPVTIVNKTQTATGEHATFDRTANKVYLLGNVTLSEGPNVTRGERVVYDLNTQTATIENGGKGGRVKALFVPGSQDDDKGGKGKK